MGTLGYYMYGTGVKDVVRLVALLRRFPCQISDGNRRPRNTPENFVHLQFSIHVDAPQHS